MNHRSDRRAVLKLLTAAPLSLAMTAVFVHDAVAQTQHSNASGRASASLVVPDLGRASAGQLISGNQLRSVTAQPAADANVVNDWNATAVAVVADAGKANAEGFLPLGFVQAAVYNAVVGITRRYSLYKSSASAAPTASPQAAAAAAAHRVLMTYFGDVPAAATRLTEAYAASTAALPTDPSTAQGIQYGRHAAERFIALRAEDGRYGPNTFDMAPAMGIWRPTPPTNASFLGKYLCDCTPLLIDSGSQFRPAPPPALASAEYAADFAEVKAFGSKEGSARTPLQTETGLFISSVAMGPLQAGLRDLTVRHDMDISARARLFAAVNMSVGDAMIAGWDSKVHYGFWRPITAIHLADEDGNSATIADASWESLIVNPPYPDYVSGANVIMGAASQALTRLLGTDRIDLTLTSPVTNTTRNYESAERLRADTVDARVWVGLHFRFADTAGMVMGQQVADWALDRYFQPL